MMASSACLCAAYSTSPTLPLGAVRLENVASEGFSIEAVHDDNESTLGVVRVTKESH